MLDFEIEKQAIQDAYEEAKLFYVFGDHDEKKQNTKPTPTASAIPTSINLPSNLNQQNNNPNTLTALPKEVDPRYLFQPEEKKHHRDKFFSFFKKSKHKKAIEPITSPSQTNFNYTPNSYNNNQNNVSSFQNTNSINSQNNSVKISETQHNEFPKDLYELSIEDYELYLDAAQDEEELKEVVHQLLKKQKCLWNVNCSNENTFLNIFLTSLRHHSIETYKDIVEKQYLKQSACFQRGEATLYRGDSRDYKIIFNEGFKLWPQHNASHINKKLYVQRPSYKVGVSLTTSEAVAKQYGQANGHYVVHLPANHHLLLVSSSSGNSAEVNSMDDIPSQYIQFFVSANGKKIPNPNYQENAIMSPKIRRGCY